MTMDWKLGAQVVTQADPWGTVWRADFEIEDWSTKPFVNRIVCWKQIGGHIAFVFAIDQNVLPL